MFSWDVLLLLIFYVGEVERLLSVLCGSSYPTKFYSTEQGISRLLEVANILILIYQIWPRGINQSCADALYDPIIKNKLVKVFIIWLP